MLSSLLLACLSSLCFAHLALDDEALPRNSSAWTNHASVLVLGGNGFLGLEFVQAAIAVNLTVTVLHRGNSYWGSSQRLAALGLQNIVCDRRALSNCSMPDGLTFDVIVDFSAQNGPQIEQAAAWAGVKGYILISSEAVYAPTLAFSPAPVKEDAFVLPSAMNWFQKVVANADTYIATKIAQEASLAALGETQEMCVVTLRLPFVVGRRDLTHRLAALQLLLEAGDVALSGAGHVPISFVDAASMASAALHLMLRAPKGLVCGEAFNVAQPSISLASVCKAAGGTTAARASLLPVSMAEGIYDAVAFSQLLPFTLSTRKLEALGWFPDVSLADAVADAALFNRQQLLESHSLEAERAALERKMSGFARRSTRLLSVLHRYGLRLIVDEASTPGFPPSSFALLVTCMILIIFSGTLCGQPSPWHIKISIAALFTWWLVTAYTKGLHTQALELCLGIELYSGWIVGKIWPYIIASEIFLGMACIGCEVQEACSAALRCKTAAAHARTRGVATHSLRFVLQIWLFFYLFFHKGARFHGEGLGPQRPEYESAIPFIIASHEAYADWSTALVVLYTYAVLYWCVLRTLTKSICHAFGDDLLRGTSTKQFLVIFSIMFAVAIFEAHHSLPERRHTTAGRTGCMTTLLFACGVLPLTGLAFVEAHARHHSLRAGSSKVE